MKASALMWFNVLVSSTAIAALAFGLAFEHSISTGFIAVALLLLLISSIVSVVKMPRGALLEPPPISVAKSETTVTFVDKDAKRASYEKTQTIIVNRDDVLSYIEKGLRPDPEYGSIENLKAESDEHGEFVKNRSIIQPDGAYEVFFASPPVKGKEFKRRVTCDFINSFPRDEEWFSISFTREVREICVTIKYYPDRPFQTANVYVLESFSTYMYHDPPLEFDESHTWLRLRLKEPRIGSQLKIAWRW